jgi:dTDP-4-amino-4,6-dideoxygalactose transaminase
MRYSIPLSYNAIDAQKVAEVFARYEGETHKQLITDFEAELAKFTGASYAVALNSGTSAIHLALKVLGVAAGDYVLAPTFTYVATINPVLYLGAVPVLVDSENETGNMDPELLEKAIRSCIDKKQVPKAIIVVHTYGMPARMDSLLNIANRYEIPMLEDAAESLGSTFENKLTGTLAPIGIYSFNSNKIATTFGGGAVVTSNEAWASRIRFLASQSRENQPHYEHKEVGYNYQMGPLSAAYGLLSLSSIGNEIDRRRAIFHKYRTALSDFLFFDAEPPHVRSNRWLSGCRFNNPEQRNLVFESLDREGIESRLFWKPMHRQPLFNNCTAFLSGCSDRLFETGLCLPSGSSLSADEIGHVINNIHNILSI